LGLIPKQAELLFSEARKDDPAAGKVRTRGNRRLAFPDSILK
jgi:hypothetical protein